MIMRQFGIYMTRDMKRDLKSIANMQDMTLKELCADIIKYLLTKDLDTVEENILFQVPISLNLITEFKKKCSKHGYKMGHLFKQELESIIKDKLYKKVNDIDEF